jgi:hypothetical protein
MFIAEEGLENVDSPEAYSGQALTHLLKGFVTNSQTTDLHDYLHIAKRAKFCLYNLQAGAITNVACISPAPTAKVI